MLSDGKARFVFRHMAFLGPESILAAEAAECAGDQGRFWDYHATLFGVDSTPTLFVNGQRVGLITSRDPVDSIQVAVQSAKPR